MPEKDTLQLIEEQIVPAEGKKIIGFFMNNELKGKKERRKEIENEILGWGFENLLLEKISIHGKQVDFLFSNNRHFYLPSLGLASILHYSSNGEETEKEIKWDFYKNKVNWAFTFEDRSKLYMIDFAQGTNGILPQIKTKLDFVGGPDLLKQPEEFKKNFHHSWEKNRTLFNCALPFLLINANLFNGIGRWLMHQILFSFCEQFNIPIWAKASKALERKGRREALLDISLKVVRDMVQYCQPYFNPLDNSPKQQERRENFENRVVSCY